MQTAQPASQSRRQVIPTASQPDGSLFGSALGKLATSTTHTSVVIAEVLLLPALFLLCGYWISPEDPLWVQAQYPWSWIAPTLIALRYGALAGLGSSAVLLAGWFFFHRMEWSDFPQLYFLGGLITVMLIGEFSSLWRHRTRRSELTQHYLDQRLEHLVRQYYLLRLSHDRLEQELIGRPMSMRDALQMLQTADSSSQASGQLVQLLSQYCQVTEAGIYEVHEGQLSNKLLASIGVLKPLNLQDALPRQALESRELCHVAQTVNTQPESQYLIAAPLKDLNGDPYAMLVVQKMPFYALNQENLQVIGLLLNYYSDGLFAKTLAAPLIALYPDCPEPFAVEIQRLNHMYAAAKIPSTMVALSFSSEAIGKRYPQQLLRMKRQLDEYWLLQSSENKQVLAVLMPLGNTSAAEGFLERIAQWLNVAPEKSLVEHGIRPHIFSLGTETSEATLQRLHGMLND